MSDNQPWLRNPVANVQWVPLDKVRSNSYNPNSVAPNEMKLLYHSIKSDGYTQPIVAIYDKQDDMFEIVDGFHRFTVMRFFPDIREANHGMLPIVVIDKPINDRMASTVRHNRARGKHSVAGMGSMVMELLMGGWDDAEVCNEIGLEAEELVRLKHVEGFSKLFENVEFRKAWTTARMEKLKRDYQKTGRCGDDPKDGDAGAGDNHSLLEEPAQEC